MNTSRIRQKGVLIRIGETAAELKLGEIRNAVKTKFGDKVLQWPKRIFEPKPKSSEMLTY
jgi:hypothetical protein